MPRHVVADLPGPAVCIAMTTIGALWLTGRALTGSLGGALAEFDVMAVVLALFVPVVALLGPRTITVDERGIEVKRRGRVVLARRMDEIAGLRGFGPASRLVFTDGAWLLWITTGRDWGPVTDLIVERIGWSEEPGALSLPASRIRFPRVCVGCGARPEVVATITARRGIDLLLYSQHVRRDIDAPACRRCAARRRWLAVLLDFGPLVGFIGCIFLPFATPLRGAPVLVLAASMILAFLALRNRGEEWGDWLIWGMRGRLTVDNIVHLRCRDPEQQAAIAAASSGTGDQEARFARLDL